MAISPMLSRTLLPLALKLLQASLQISVTPPPDGAELPRKGTIFAFWHGQMIAGWLLARKLFPGQKISAVVSLSGDGRILSDALGRLGFSLIRGSSSKGSSGVLLAMKSTLDKGEIVAVTPDGPRGPISTFKYGLLRFASSSQTPLIFADIRYANCWKLKSWDRFAIPKPFSRASVTLHCIDLPKFASEEELHRYAAQLSDRFSHE